MIQFLYIYIFYIIIITFLYTFYTIFNYNYYLDTYFIRLYIVSTCILKMHQSSIREYQFNIWTLQVYQCADVV